MEFIPAKSILQKVNFDPKHWFGINYNMNLYKGCCHGCIYCDSRSNCYGIDHFDVVRAKENALGILNKELKNKRQSGVIGIGAMSDTYNPFENQLLLTRKALELAAYYGFGISIDTKSDLVVRDIDVLTKIQEHNCVIVKLTITTADDKLSGMLEPNVCVSSQRFLAVKQLADAGIFTGILFTPILPFLTDSLDQVRQLVYKAHIHHAKFIFSMFGVTLRENQRDYFYEQLDILFPGLKKKYQQTFRNQQYVCNPVDLANLQSVFEEECEKYGILYQMNDIIDAYQKHPGFEQLCFDFD